MFKRVQDDIIRLGSKSDEIALNVGAHEALVRTRPRRPELFWPITGHYNFAQCDGVGRAGKADAPIAAIRCVNEPGGGQGNQQFAYSRGITPTPLANCEELNCAIPSAWANARLSIKCSAVGNLTSIIV